MKEKTSLTWFVPFAVHKQKTLDELKKAFPAAALIRIALAFTVFYIAIRHILIRKIPELDFEWTTAYLQCVLSGAALIATCYLISLIPSLVTVKVRGIVVQQGQSAIWHIWKDIASIRIDAESKPYPLLKITLYSQQESKEYPISSKVSLDRLAVLIEKYRFTR